MRLVQVHDGVLEIRWTWLPYWLAANPKMKDVERKMRDAVVLNGLTTADDDLDALHVFVREQFEALFPSFPGLGQYLDALSNVQEPPN